MEHCMVNGERCSKCCEVLTMRESKNFRDWRSYARRYGYPDNTKVDKIHHMVRKISKRRAKKINPHLLSEVGKDKSQHYFTCKNLTENGCGAYESRPRMCSEFPHYGRTEREWQESDEFKGGGLYDKDCTYHIQIKQVD